MYATRRTHKGQQKKKSVDQGHLAEVKERKFICVCVCSHIDALSPYYGLGENFPVCVSRVVLLGALQDQPGSGP